MASGGERADPGGAKVKDAKALQLYYTSCRRGLSGYAGFQTRAESQGLLLDERREIEAKALYQPPRDLPREPDAEAIAGHFPKAFRTVKLSSGRTAVIRAVYTGQDYSDRWGNYFAHALVLDGELEGRWPIDAYTWPGWVEGLADGVDESEPKPLPPVPLGDVAIGTDFSFDELETFLGEGEERAEMLSKMLRAVFRRASDSRSVVIRERLELDGVYWVACIQKAFPPAYQRELTCSTFQFDPRSSLAVNVTTGETDFLFDEGERKYQFYVFDFVTGEHSDVPEEGAEYARALSAWMASDPRRVEGFHGFAALFDHNEFGPDLLHILRLYRLEAGDDVALTTPELHSALEFVNAHARPSAFARVLEAVGEVTRYLDPAVPPEDWALVVRFLAERAASTGEAEHRRRACLAWIDAFDFFVVEQQRDEDVVLSLRGDVEKKFGRDARDIAQEFLSDTHLDWMWEHAARLPSRGLGLVMTEIDRSCRQLGREPTHESQEVRSLIEAVLYREPGQPPDLQWAFAPFRSQVGGLASIANHVVEVLAEQVREGSMPREVWQEACRVVGRSLSGVLTAAGDGLRFKLLNCLKTDDRFAGVLLGEWEVSIDRATDKIEAHSSYEHNVLSDDSKFAGDMRDLMAAALLKVLPLDSQRRQARLWVESDQCRRYSDDVAGTILALASQDVNLSPEDSASERLADQISQELDGRRLKLDLIRLELRAAACRALSAPDGANGLRAVLEEADAGSYGEFVGMVLPRLLSRAATPEGHGRVVLSMVTDAHLRAVAEAYGRFLTQRPTDRFDDVDLAALVFWLRLVETDSAWPLLCRLREPALDVIATRISYMRGKTRSKVDGYLEKSLALQGPQLRRAWEAFLERVDARRPSLIDRARGGIKNVAMKVKFDHGER